MHSRQWLSQVETTMLRAGLPKPYVARTCAELVDHLETSHFERDLSENCPREVAEETLLDESPHDLAKAVVNSYRSRGIFRRIPPVLLLLLPLPLVVLTTLAYFMACYVLLDLMFDCFQGDQALPLQVTATMWACFYAGKLAGPLLSGLAVREIAVRMARPWYWAALLFGVQCLAVAATRSELELELNDSSLNIQLGSEQVLYTTQIVSAAAIALLGLYVVKKQRQDQLHSLAPTE